VVHFKGTPFLYDVCIDREQLLDKAALLKHKSDSNRRVRMPDVALSPIPDYLGLGFLNSLLLVLLSNDSLGLYFRQRNIPAQGPTNFVEYLCLIYRMLTSGGEVVPSVVADFVRHFFPEYFHFELTMAEDVPLPRPSSSRSSCGCSTRRLRSWRGAVPSTPSKTT
jgi:hypothetical protein